MTYKLLCVVNINVNICHRSTMIKLLFVFIAEKNFYGRLNSNKFIIGIDIDANQALSALRVV